MDSSTQNEDQLITGFKKTKLGWIPEEWGIHRFDKVFDFKKSYSFSRNDLTFEEDEGDTFYIHYGDIHSKFDTLILHLHEENHAEIPLLKQSSKPEKDLIYLEEGDLVIADASEDYEGVGECIEIGELTNSKNLIAGLHTIVARDKNGKTADRYRAYILKNWPVAKELKKIATGISVFGISKGNLSKLRIPLPSLPEQKKIADILSTWDRAIETLDRLIAKKEELKKGLMQQLLTGKKQFPGFEGEWREVRFKDVVKIDAKSLNSKTSPDYEFEYISLSDVENGHISNDLEVYEFKDAPSRAKRIVSEGDILMATVRPNLQAFAMAKKEHNGKIASTGFAVLTPKKNFNIRYLYHYLYSHHISGQFYALTVGSNYPAINSSDVKKLKIRLPADNEEINKIESVLTNIDKEIKSLEKNKELLVIQKKGLMQQLLTGKTRVKVEKN
ncbi:restriction endonuclease subunit S [Rhodohalobacter halophilus]|uniref:restriction endonuclease subunit S n=1 Tax=Rhodohalobacter halophilus TaxID=1812810 RepID=UPI00083F83EC|nr:restriction endonuclease subunit S [Rhodohalobacter halophilus]